MYAGKGAALRQGGRLPLCRIMCGKLGFYAILLQRKISTKTGSKRLFQKTAFGFPNKFDIFINYFQTADDNDEP